MVTHHKPEIVDEANNALRTIENVRTTLLNAEKRSEYDKQLTATLGNQAGLSDPDAIFTSSGSNFGGNFSGIPPQRPSPVLPQAERTDAWICPNTACKKANPIGTTFCANCGETLAKNCPNCGALVEASNKFCSNCGVDKQSFFEESKKAEIQALREQQSKVEQLLQEAENNPLAFAKNHKEFIPDTGCLLPFITIILAVASMFLIRNWSGSMVLAVLVAFGITFGVILLERALKGKKSINEKLLPQLKSIEGQIEEVKKRKY